MNDRVHTHTLALIYNRQDPTIWNASISNRGDVIDIPKDKLPAYVFERVALLKLTTEKEQGVIGRKLNDLMFTIYLTYDEYKELNSLSGA